MQNYAQEKNHPGLLIFWGFRFCSQLTNIFLVHIHNTSLNPGVNIACPLANTPLEACWKDLA